MEIKFITGPVIVVASTYRISDRGYELAKDDVHTKRYNFDSHQMAYSFIKSMEAVPSPFQPTGAEGTMIFKCPRGSWNYMNYFVYPA